MTAYPGGRVASTAPSAAVHYGSARRGAAQKSFNTCRVSAAIPHYTFADGRRTPSHDRSCRRSSAKWRPNGTTEPAKSPDEAAPGL